MRPIAILPRAGQPIGICLNEVIALLRTAGINVRNAVMGQQLALIWVDDEIVSVSLETLRSVGVAATLITETEGPC